MDESLFSFLSLFIARYHRVFPNKKFRPGSHFCEPISQPGEVLVVTGQEQSDFVDIMGDIYFIEGKYRKFTMAGKTAGKNNSELILKIVESIGWAIGPAVFALNFFSFKLSKAGVYYDSGSEWGIAVGILLISMAYVARQWQK